MPWSTVTDNVLLPFRIARNLGGAERERAAAALRAVGLAGFEKSYPHQLSGGMRMRVSIARALVTQPDLLLLDEPFAALDEITRLALNDDLLRLWEAQRPTVLFVTHSVFESVYLSTRIAVMAARPRPHRRRLAGRPAASARAQRANQPRIRGAVRQGVGGARQCNDAGARPVSAQNSLRVALPILIGVLFLGVVGGGGPRRGNRALHFARPQRSRAEPVDRWAEPDGFAAGDVAHHPGGVGGGGVDRRSAGDPVLIVANS